MSEKSGTSLTGTGDESGMVKVMGMVIFSLLLLALFLVSMARLLGMGRGDADNDPLMRNALISRIEPVGAVRTSAEDLQVAAADTGGGAERSGEELVQGVCAGCHAAGVAGAPKLGDEQAWAARREQGLDALVASVTNGKGSMPARGGSDYSDEEIRRATQYIAMFEDTGESEGGDGAADAGAAAAPDAGTMSDASAAADEPSGGQVRPADQAVEGTAMAATAGAADDADSADTEGAVTTRDLPGDEVETNEVAEAAVASDVGTAPPEADMAGDELVALIGSGEEPAGLTDDIRAQVDGVCAGCHMAGVAGAPKLGDKAAWTPRAETGLAALTQAVIDGKNAMPPRGGSTLTDEQIPIAIRYQIAKQ